MQCREYSAIKKIYKKLVIIKLCIYLYEKILRISAEPQFFYGTEEYTCEKAELNELITRINLACKHGLNDYFK